MIVDVHCHTFNASDLSVYGFLRKIEFPQVPDYLLGPLLALLTRLADLAPTAEAESAGLDGQPALLAAAPAREDLFKEHLAAGLEGLKQGPTDSERQLYQAIVAEVDAHQPGFLALETPLLAADPWHLAGAVLEAPGTITRYIQWIRTLTWHREEIIAAFRRCYKVDLFTPALVDYGMWLGEPRSSITAQNEVFGKLALEQNGAMHPFAAFDPWRDAAGTPPGQALSWVQDAIHNQGFIGVKLYPTMGFRPLGNTALSFPKGAPPGSAIDASMRALFCWAQNNHVPIMAHCGCSNGPNPEAKACANPKFWRTALEEFPKLKVNLGHLGGGARSEELAGSVPWDEEIAKLMRDYDNVYADLAYRTEILTGDGSFLDGIVVLMGRYPVLKQRLMYGSDWIMLAQEPGYERYLTAFEQALASHAQLDADFATGFFGENALAFLGLTPGGMSARRLERYYTTAAMEKPAWLAGHAKKRKAAVKKLVSAR